MELLVLFLRVIRIKTYNNSSFYPCLFVTLQKDMIK